MKGLLRNGLICYIIRRVALLRKDFVIFFGVNHVIKVCFSYAFKAKTLMIVNEEFKPHASEPQRQLPRA